MIPRTFSLSGFLFAVTCVAIPALAAGLGDDVGGLPSNVSPEGVVGVGFLYILREIFMRQAGQLDVAIKALAARVTEQKEGDE